MKPFFTGGIASIRKADVQRYITKRSGERKSKKSKIMISPATVTKELNVLKHLLGLTVEWEIIPINPAQNVKPPKPSAGRVRYLQPTELKVLLEACPLWLQPIVALAVCTGMRRGEILGLRWLDIDLNNNRILLPQTKNGDGRIVYLNQAAQSALMSLPYNDETSSTDKPFANITLDQVSVSFHRICARVGIADFRFHDLRHTAASWLRMSGADIHTVALLLGHKDLRMAARYQHLSPAFLAEAVSRLDGVFGFERYQYVTSPKAITSRLALSASK